MNGKIKPFLSYLLILPLPQLSTVATLNVQKIMGNPLTALRDAPHAGLVINDCQPNSAIRSPGGGAALPTVEIQCPINVCCSVRACQAVAFIIGF